MVTLKSVMGLPGRALCGFVESIFELMGSGPERARPHDDIEKAKAFGG